MKIHICILILAAGPLATASILIDSTAAGTYYGSTAFGSESEIAIPFATPTGAGYYLTSMQIELAQDWSFAAFTAELYLAGADNIPIGSALASFHIPAIDSMMNLITFTPLGTPNLQAETSYALVLSASDFNQGQWHLALRQGGTTAGTGSMPSLAWYRDLSVNPASWIDLGQSLLGESDLRFSTTVSVSPIPEPGGFGLLASIAALCAGVMRRKFIAGRD